MSDVSQQLEHSLGLNAEHTTKRLLPAALLSDLTALASETVAIATGNKNSGPLGSNPSRRII